MNREVDFIFPRNNGIVTSLQGKGTYINTLQQIGNKMIEDIDEKCNFVTMTDDELITFLEENKNGPIND
jgi:hypothetical protein